jgi:hypothetical protein
MKILLSFFLICISVPAFSAWDLNDVSYLMPLPTQINNDGLLRFESEGARGPLLTADLILNLPVIAAGFDAGVEQDTLRVVGVRIDPCFPLPTPQSCQRQIRLIWQPISLDPRTRQVSTTDAAVHSFYLLSDTDFSALLKDLANWKKKFKVRTQGLPLQVHPAWKKDSDSSLREFEKIILKYAGQENLMRVTVMILGGADNLWQFVGFSVVNGQLQEIMIPRLSLSSAQTFVNSSNTDIFRGGFAPKPQGEDLLNHLILNSDGLKDQDELIQKEVGAAYKIENPKFYTPENMDCVSCHTAQTARLWSLRNRPQLKLDQVWDSVSYKNLKYNLSNNSPEVWNTHNLRGFGYFERGMALSQRVINESAEVADAINALTGGN